MKLFAYIIGLILTLGPIVGLVVSAVLNCIFPLDPDLQMARMLLCIAGGTMTSIFMMVIWDMVDETGESEL